MSIIRLMKFTRPETISNDAIAQRLVVTREALGLRQGEFAARADIAANTYNQYEQGKNRISLDKAIALCDEFGMTLDWIYRGEPSGLKVALWNAIRDYVNVHNIQFP